MTGCPTVEHLAYPSETVAENAVTLHTWAIPACHTFHAFACGDHWHVGHLYRAAGDACKATQEVELETIRRRRGRGVRPQRRRQRFKL